MTEFIPSRKAPGFQEIATAPDVERAWLAPHYIQEHGRTRIVYPAMGMALGMLEDFATGNAHPAIRVDHAAGPTSLALVPTAEELRTLGKAMVELTDDMEREASDLLAQALAKRPGA